MDIEIKADAVAVQGVPHQLTVSQAGDQGVGQAAPEDAVGVAGLTNLLAGKHVVVVGVNYAPEPTGIAPHTTAICEHLATRARLVTVLTGLPHFPTWRVPAAYRGFRRNPEQHTPSLHVVRHKHYVPGRMTTLTRGAYEASFLARVSRTAIDELPDLVVAVTPSLAGAVAGARLAKRHGCPLVVVVHDLVGRAAVPGDAVQGGAAPVRGAARREQRALAAADRLLIVSDALRPQLREYGIPDDRIDLAPTWSHLVPSPMTPAEAKRALGWPAGRFTVVHAGATGFQQGLSTAVEAAAELGHRNAGVDLVLVGDGSQRKALQAMASRLPNVRFVDPVGEDEYPTVLAAADLLLLCERGGPTDHPVPSELTSYLVASRPIVASVTASGATARELARVAGAVEVIDAGHGWALADAIMVLRLAEERRGAMAMAAGAYGRAQLGADVALRRIENIVARAVGG